jgi:hypothetical protein
MRLKFIASAVAALAAVFGIHGAAQADHGGCGASAVVACCPAADCCQPKVRYKKEWQTVVEQRTKTCYKTVSRTVMKEVCQVVCRPVQEQKEVVCKRIVCEPVWSEKQVKVCSGEWVNEMHQTPCQTVCKRVRVEPCEPCVDPCDPCAKKGHGFLHKFKREYVTVQETIPGKTVCRKVWKPREEVRTVKTCQMVAREVVERKMVTTCRMERQEVRKMVPVTVCERVPYCVTENVCKRVRVCVPVCDDRCGGHKLFGGLFGHRSRKSCDTCGHAPCGCAGAPGHLAPAPVGGAYQAPMPAPAPAPR